jgi:FKBP-type peptidyl-prolyl cis-trans isomerase FkpA
MKKYVLFAAVLFGSGLLMTQPLIAEEKKVDEKITTLKIIDNKIGEGKEANAGSTVTVDYTGWLYDPAAPDKKGKKFDSSLDRGDPFAFVLGRGSVIRGWDEGVKGMKEDGQRTLIIPSDMAYGNRGAGGLIPPGATLVFDVELISVK